MSSLSAELDRAGPARLAPWAGFAAVLAAAGLPIYIHAPKVYADAYGVSLAALGTVLFVLRLIDVVQDPLFGRLAGALGAWRALAVAIGGGTMALGMVALFAVTPPIAPIWWFAISLTLVFSSFSFLNIVFYATGVAKADRLPGQGHLHLARWRESGALLGVCVAAMLPTVIEAVGLPPYAGFAMAFALATAVVVWAMRGAWNEAGDVPSAGFGIVLGDFVARRLLIVALCNAAPVAVSSTLFLFFVESRLDAPGWEGPLLLFFFLAAALSAPVWGLLAERFGPKRVLLAAMVLAIIAFSGAMTLGAGDVALFALICLGSGAAMGADLTLLPAMFATRMARIAPNAAEGFALWSFVSKLTLAFAAIALLPLLEMQGFQSGTDNTEQALWILSLFYAGIPCVLKIAAIAMLLATPVEETP